jgi:MazG family protein
MAALRHPETVAPDQCDVSEAVLGNWDRAKAEERERKRAGKGGEAPGLLDDVPLALPGLTRAVKLQRRAGTVGFDWNDARTVLDKIKEETAELEAELDAKSGPALLEEEIGDLLFAVANLARHLKIDPERAVRSANSKFVRRFRHIERRLSEAAIARADADLALMESFWDEAKRAENKG